MSSSCVCDRCGAPMEDILHVLRDCMATKGFWNLVLPMAHQQEFYNLSLRDWICRNLESQWALQNGLKWSCFFGVAIWGLWFWRNQFIIKHFTLGRTDLLNDVMDRAEEIQHLFNSSLMPGRQKIEKWFGWSAPVWPWCKLNTDEACKQLGVSSVGGLIRDYTERLVKGFCMNIGSCSVTMAEL